MDIVGRARAKAGLTLGLIAICLGLFSGFAAPAEAAGPDGPDTCLYGYVWREAGPDDHVCVTPARRDRAAQDNELADSRRDPNGGEWGPDTCLEGFVWRDAFADDHVCVTPARFDQVQDENAKAPSRRARDSFTDTDSLSGSDVNGSMTLDLRPNGDYRFQGWVRNNARVAHTVRVVCLVPLLDGGALEFRASRNVPGEWGSIVGRDNERSWNEGNTSGQVERNWGAIPRDTAATCGVSSSIDFGPLSRDIAAVIGVAAAVTSIVVAVA